MRTWPISCLLQRLLNSRESHHTNIFHIKKKPCHFLPCLDWITLVCDLSKHERLYHPLLCKLHIFIYHAFYLISHFEFIGINIYCWQIRRKLEMKKKKKILLHHCQHNIPQLSNLTKFSNIYNCNYGCF